MNTEEPEHDKTAIVEDGFPVAISSLGVMLNFLSISGILGRKPLRRWTNIFTLNLSLSDFVASLGILISYVPRLHQGIEYLPWSEPIFTTGLIMSILSTLVIAVHRFIIVRFDPLGNRKIVTPCRSITVCVIGWVTVATVYTVAFYLEGSDPIISRIGSTVAIWVSLVLTSLCYIFIYCRIACSSKLRVLTEQMLSVQKRILLTFALVIGSTFFCWIPISLILLLEGLGILEDAKWVNIFDKIAFNLLCVNQVINPLIYWTRLTEFRDQLPCCGRRRLPEDEQAITMSNVSLHDKEANRSIRI